MLTRPQMPRDINLETVVSECHGPQGGGSVPVNSQNSIKCCEKSEYDERQVQFLGFL